MPLRIHVEVAEADEAAARRARADAVRALATDLRKRGVDTRRETAPAPEGSKSVAADLGVLVVSGLLSASSINALARVVIARGRDRVEARTAKKIVLRADSVEISSDATVEEIELVIKAYQARQLERGDGQES